VSSLISGATAVSSAVTGTYPATRFNPLGWMGNFAKEMSLAALDPRPQATYRACFRPRRLPLPGRLNSLIPTRHQTRQLFRSIRIPYGLIQRISRSPRYHRPNAAFFLSTGRHRLQGGGDYFRFNFALSRQRFRSGRQKSVYAFVHARVCDKYLTVFPISRWCGSVFDSSSAAVRLTPIHSGGLCPRGISVPIVNAWNRFTSR